MKVILETSVDYGESGENGARNKIRKVLNVCELCHLQLGNGVKGIANVLISYQIHFCNLKSNYNFKKYRVIESYRQRCFQRRCHSNPHFGWSLDGWVPLIVWHMSFCFRQTQILRPRKGLLSIRWKPGKYHITHHPKDVTETPWADAACSCSRNRHLMVSSVLGYLW